MSTSSLDTSHEPAEMDKSSRTTAPRSPLNVGVIGAGYVATAAHIPFLKAIQIANLVAVADSVPGRASAVASEYGIPIHTADYTTLLSNEDIHVIDICTPVQFHAQIAVDALEAGKHVIIEKPMAVDPEQVASIRAVLARRPNVHVGVVLNLRYMPLIHAMIQVLHGSRLGQIRNVAAVVRTAMPSGGVLAGTDLVRYGVLYDYLPHIIDLVGWALQARPVSVRCTSNSSVGSGFSLLVEFHSVLTGVCFLLADVAWTTATSMRSIQFRGTERDLSVDMQDQVLSLTRGHITPIKRTEELMRRMVALGKRAAGGRISIRYGGMIYHRELLRDFLEAFAAERCPRVALDDGMLHVATIAAAIRSHMEDRAVAVSTEPAVLS